MVGHAKLLILVGRIYDVIDNRFLVIIRWYSKTHKILATPINQATAQKFEIWQSYELKPPADRKWK